MDNTSPNTQFQQTLPNGFYRSFHIPLIVLPEHGLISTMDNTSPNTQFQQTLPKDFYKSSHISLIVLPELCLISPMDNTLPNTKFQQTLHNISALWHPVPTSHSCFCACQHVYSPHPTCCNLSSSLLTFLSNC